MGLVPVLVGCAYCDWTPCTARPDALEVHEATDHPEEIEKRVYEAANPVLCKWYLCSFRCACAADLATHHTAVHTGVNKYACEEPGCKYTCARRENLALHRRHHREPYECGLCTHTCARHAELLVHNIDVHGAKKKKNACSVEGCGFRYNTPSQLTNHMVVHTGEKKFQCPDCDYKCSLIGSLKRHARIHRC
jgi:hypothetical protein